MGGDSVVRNFYRLFLVPGMAHGFSNGTTNPAANPPLPTINLLYTALTAWVELGNSPERIDISAPASGGTPAEFAADLHASDQGDADRRRSARGGVVCLLLIGATTPSGASPARRRS